VLFFPRLISECDLPASASQVLGLQACTTMPDFRMGFKYLWSVIWLAICKVLGWAEKLWNKPCPDPGDSA
jgi:hypothetical protein